MITLITSDLHLTDTPRDMYRHDFQDRLRQIIKARKVERLFILGDLTEKFDNHGSWLVNTIVDHVFNLASLCNVTIVKGNHDQSNPDNPFFKFLSYLPCVDFIIHPEWVDDWLILPHTSNPKRDWAGVDMSGAGRILAHATFEGALAEGGFKLDGVPLSLLPRGAKVISGDVHTPQQLGPVTYVGAPYTVDFGDDYKPRVLVVDNDKLISIPTGGVQKRLLDLPGWNSPMMKQLPPGVRGWGQGDIVKVRVKLTREDYPRAREIEAEIREWGDKAGFVMHAVQITASDNTIARTKPRDAHLKTDVELVKAYAKHRQADGATLTTGLKMVEK